MKRFLTSGLFAAIFLTCTCPIEAHVSRQMREACQSHKFAKLQEALEKKSDSPDSEELKKVARQYKENKLLRAVKAYDSLKPNRKLCTKKEFLQTALFIECKLPFEVKGHKHYFSKTKTHLPLSIDYDPEFKKSFIQLDRRKGAKIGAGKFKKVTRAILYGQHSEVVAKASAKCSRKLLRELELTRKVHGKTGVFDTKGFTVHRKQSGKKICSIYSKLYNAGSLQDIFDEKKKLSRWEKVRIAKDLIFGLAALHEKGIAHRDLGCRNYLINIPKGKPGRRHVNAVIADLGCSDYARNSVHYKVQGNTSYTSPEGLFKQRMKHHDYYKSDVFALGTVLFQLIRGEPPEWQDHYWVKGRDMPLDIRHHEMVRCIKDSIKERLEKLRHKKARGKLTRMKELELLMYEMVNPNPEMRPSAAALKPKVEKIWQRFN